MRKYGCFDRKPFEEAMPVQDGWIYGGDVRMAKVKQSPFKMAKTCQFALTELGRVDPLCDGCKHKEAK